MLRISPRSLTWYSSLFLRGTCSFGTRLKVMQFSAYKQALLNNGVYHETNSEFYTTFISFAQNQDYPYRKELMVRIYKVTN